MSISVRELTTYDISADGKSVVLKFLDGDGNTRALSFNIAELGNLVVTLPALIEAALRRQCSDMSLRFAYPMEDWSIEQASDPKSVILTLRTTDGFGVSYSMPKGRAEELGKGLAAAEKAPVEAILMH